MGLVSESNLLKKKKKLLLASTQGDFNFQCLFFGIQSVSPHKSTITKGWLGLQYNPEKHFELPYY